MITQTKNLLGHLKHHRTWFKYSPLSLNLPLGDCHITGAFYKLCKLSICHFMYIHEKSTYLHKMTRLFTRQRLVVLSLCAHDKFPSFDPNHGRMLSVWQLGSSLNICSSAISPHAIMETHARAKIRGRTVINGWIHKSKKAGLSK